MTRKKKLSSLLNPKILLSLGILLIIIFLLFYRQQGSTGFVKAPPFSQWAYQSNIANSTIISSAKNDSENAIINFQYKDSQLEFNLPLANSKLDLDKNKSVVFSTPKKDIEVKYTNISNGIKEDIILHKTPITTKFTSTLKTTNADIYLNSDNLPVFLEPTTKKYLFHVQKPYAIDASGNKTFAVTYQLLKNNQPLDSSNTNNKLSLLNKLIKLDQNATYSLAIKVDPNWLLDPKRIYPITIDPTIIHDLQSEFSLGSLNRIYDSGSVDASPSLSSYYQELSADLNTVGLWHLNETIGTTIGDSSGNSNTGTLTGTSLVTGILSNARSFNGSSDHIGLATANNVDIVGGQISIELWINPTSFAATGVPIHKDGQYSFAIDTSGYVAWADSSNWSFPNFGYTNIGLVTGKWQHLAFTKSNGIVKIYLDGIEKASKTFGGSISSTANTMHLGCFFATGVCSSYFNGLLDEVRISNIARSAEEIKADASRRRSAIYTSSVIDFGANNPPTWNSLSWTVNGNTTGDGETLSSSTSLVAQWNFNETSGATAVSGGSCGTTCNGTLTNFADTTGQDVGGTMDGWTAANKKWGTGALMFDGTNDYVSCTDANCGGTSKLDVPSTNGVTYSAWVNPSSFPGTAPVIMGKAGNSSGFWVLVNSSGQIRAEMGNSACNNDSGYGYQPYTLPVGKWSHIAVTVSAANPGILKIYVNGALIFTSPATAYYCDQSGNFYIGNFDTAGHNWQGVIDSVSVYSRVLTPAEILSNYNAGSLEFQTRTGSSSDPNDGTWTDWSPSAGETQIDSFDPDIANWSRDNTASTMPVNKYNDTITKLEGSGSMKIALGVAQTDTNTIALWHFDETGTDVGTTFYDSSGNNKHGVGSATPVVTNGVFSKSRNFDGSTQSISVGASLTSIKTVEMWVKPSSTHTSGLIQLQSGIGVSSSPSGSITANGFTSPTIYVNGSIGSTLNFDTWNYVVVTTGTGFTGNSNIIGYFGTRYYWGSIDEVRISNIARSAEEIAENYRMGRDHYLNKTISSTDLSAKTTLPFYVAADRPGTYLTATAGESNFANYQPDANTVGLWHLDEGDVGTTSTPSAFLKDASGNNNNGTPGAGTSFPALTTGKIGQGRNLNGFSNFITAPNINIGNSSFTISTWAKANVLGSDMIIISVGNTGVINQNVHLAFLANNKFRFGFYSNDLDTPPTLSDTNWHLWICTFDANSKVRKIYRDGVLQISDVSASNFIGGGTLIMGRLVLTSSVYNNNFSVDEVRVDNVVRTADEIRQAYEIGLRSHPITIDFAADLDAGNLIANSADLSFTVDATHYGLSQKGSMIFPADKIIIREQVGTTEFVAQGTVNSVNLSTGAITVSSWDATSTFPSGGFTANANVFKWQREFWNISAPLDSHVNATTNLTLRVTNGNEGRTVWLDDLKSSSGFLTNSISSTITSAPALRYFQYRSILSSFDEAVSPSLTSVTLNYNDNPFSAGNCRVLEDNNATSFTVAWTEISTILTGFEIQRSTNGGAWTVLQTGIGAGITSFTDTTVTRGNTYIYRVAPYASAIYSPWCTTAQISLSNPTNNFKFGGLNLNGININ